MQRLCPTCRSPVAPAARAFPFCSERCRTIDLGGWLDERYRVAGSEEEDAADARPSEEGEPIS